MVLAFGLVLLGVNFGLRGDVNRLATRSVDAGANALASAVATRVEQTRTVILQGSALPSLAKAVSSHDIAALRAAASDTAISGNLSFVVVTDAKGTVLAGSRAASGSLAEEGAVRGALEGNLVGGPELLDARELQTLGVTIAAPAVAIVTANPVNVNGAVVGVLYGGSVLDSTTTFVNDVAALTGGQTGVVRARRWLRPRLRTRTARRRSD